MEDTPTQQQSAPSSPAARSPLQPEPQKNRNTIIIASTALGLILILSIIIIINGQRNSHVLTLPAHQENTTAEATPTPIITDTAPAVPANQKAKIIVHHSDSSFETFLVPTTNIEIFKKSLQPGDTIFQTIQPQQ
jgi:hypothetical protein